MLIEFATGTKWDEIKAVLSKMEKEYWITLFCASTWQTTETKKNYTVFECIRKD